MKTPPTLGRTIAINGMEMYYEMRGTDEPLILLHGGAPRGGCQFLRL